MVNRSNSAKTWPRVRLGDVCERLKAGGTPSRAEPAYWGGYIPFVKIEDITASHGDIRTTEECITEQGLTNSSAWIVPTNSVLLAMYASIGATAISRIPVATNQAIIAAVPDRVNLDADFLYFLLVHSGKSLVSYSIQTTQKNITKGIVENWPIPLPPLEVQKKIASILRSIEFAVKARRRELALERERKAALMHHLFTHGTRGEPTKQTEIGEMPESWELEPLGQHIADGPQNGMYKHQDEYGSGTPIVRINDFDNDGAFITTNFQRVRLTPEESERYQLSESDLLINRVNSLSHLGKSTRVPALPEATVFESNMMRLRVDIDTLRPRFLMRFLTLSGTRDRMRQMAKLAVAQASINQGDTKSLLIPIPSLEEQRRIEQVLDIQDEAIQVIAREVTALGELFSAMLAELMTGSVSAKR